MPDFRIRVSLVDQRYDSNDYIVRGVESKGKAAQQLCNLQCDVQNEGRSVPLTGEYGNISHLVLQGDGTYVPLVSKDQQSLHVLEQTPGTEFMKFELLDESGEVVGLLGAMTPEMYRQDEVIKQDDPVEKKEFRIRAFRQSLAYVDQDFLVTGVDTVEEAALKVAKLQAEAQGKVKSIPLSESDGVIPLENPTIRGVIELIPSERRCVDPLELPEADIQVGYVEINKGGGVVRHLTHATPMCETNIGIPLDPEWEWPDEEDYVDGPEDEEPPGES